MKRMIDPSTIKVDTSNFWNMGTHFEGTGSNNDRRYFGWSDGYHCFFFEKQSSLGQDALGVRSSGPTYGITSNGFFYIPSGVALNGNQPIGVENPYQIFEFPIKYDGLTKNDYQKILTDKTLKTLFGQSIYSRYGTGNIDLYKHNLKGVKEDNQVYISIPSSKNTPINSITDLNTYLSNDDYYPATGVYKDVTTFYPIVFMTKSNNVWSVTYNKGTELGTALLSAVVGTITDTVTTV